MQELKPFKQNYGSINLIEAAAGTGKTYNITALYLRYLIEQELEVQQILVVTFTRAATGELKDRLLTAIQKSISMLRTDECGNDHMLLALKDWLAETSVSKAEAVKKLKKAERNFNRAQVFTIHAFCNKVLQSEAFRSGNLFESELIEEELNRELTQEAIDDYWRSLNEPEDLEKALDTYLLKEFENPEKLMDCIHSFLGKSYLQFTPDNLSLQELETVLGECEAAFEALKKHWFGEQDSILELFKWDCLSAYKNHAKSRKDKVEAWIKQDISSKEPPSQIKYFQQSIINNSLKKSARENGASAPTHPFFTKADEFIPIQQKVEMLKGAWLEPAIQQIRKALWQKKETAEVFSYDDVLNQLRNSLTDEDSGPHLSRKLQKLYPVALVDEFQDTDPVQYEIFREIYGSGKSDAQLFMVGDPKQAIYNFRGADIFVYLAARQDSKKQARYKLSRNYRSVPPLLEGINYLFERIEKPFILEDIQYQNMAPGKKPEEYNYLKINGKKQKPLQLWNLNSIENKKPSKRQLCKIVEDAVADEILNLLSLGETGRAKIGANPVQAGDIAVLVRKHKQGEAMQQALKRRGVKNILISKKSVFATDEAFELELLLKAIAEPENESALSAALATRLLGFSGEEMMAIQSDESRWITFINKFREWNEALEKDGFASVFRTVLQEKKIARRLMNDANGERRITNLHHLGELLQQHEHKTHTNLSGLIKWLSACRREKKSENEALQLRLESDENLVTINTLHKSKGLEYPIVFCPYLWEGMKVTDGNGPFIFHDEATADSAAFLDVGGAARERAEHLFQKYREDLSEEMRLAYVAMTRSKQCCYLPWVKDVNYRTSSSVSSLGIILNGRQEGLRYLNRKASGNGKSPKPDYSKAFELIKEQASEWIATESPSREPATNGAAMEAEKVKMQTRKWNRQAEIKANQTVSFSSLAYHSADIDDDHDYDQWAFQAEKDFEPNEPLTIFNFPRGIEAGRCMHNIFELIDFGRPLDDPFNYQLIQDSLDRYGIHRKWIKPLLQSIRMALNRPLVKGDFAVKLSNIVQENEQREMEFYFPVQSLKASKLMSFIGRKSSSLSDQEINGFMRGFIDLTFNINGRYYLLDYKSNHLGDNPEDYDEGNLQKTIREHLYDLQYYIYTVAIHRFLEQRLAGYNYEKHFGGVIYLFLRGVTDNPENFSGIHYQRPSLDKIEQLNNYLKEGGGVK